MSNQSELNRTKAQIDAAMRQIKRQWNAVASNVAQEAGKNLVTGGAYSPGTPRDTGFAQSAWQAMINGSVLSGRNKQKAVLGSRSQGVKGVSYQPAVLLLGNVKAGDRVSFSNYASYIELLEYGSSNQAPNGMIGLTAAAMPLIVAAEIAKVFK